MWKYLIGAFALGAYMQSKGYGPGQMVVDGINYGWDLYGEWNNRRNQASKPSEPPMAQAA
jgi:hypothetical protein